MKQLPSTRSLAPRRTARQTRATLTVEAIIEAAAVVLETNGFENYTTNAIAQRAGVSIGSLYQYFPHRDAVTLALIEREAAILLVDIREAAAASDWRAALAAMVGAAVRHWLRRPGLARLLDFEEGRLRLTKESVSGACAVRAAVFAVVVQIDLQPRHAETLTADIIGIMRGMTEMAGRLGEAKPEGLAHRVLRTILSYLRDD